MTSALKNMVDGVTAGEVRSEPGKKGLSWQHDDGFAWVRSRGTPRGDLLAVSRATCAPLKGSKTVKMARPRHNSGLTGGLSRFGILVKNGYELWKETVNAAGGIEVAGKKMKAEIVYYDDQSENETSAKLTEKLITDDKVQFLLSPFGSGPTFATTAI